MQPCIHEEKYSWRKTGAFDPGFSFGATELVRQREVVGGVVAGIVQIPEDQLVSTERIGGSSALGSGSIGCLSGVMVVVVLRSHGGTADGESGRSGQNKKSHDRILVFCFLKAKRRTPESLNDMAQQVETRFGKLFIAGS
jgi:hypothetical protein